jgi:uncharacterized surface protein with fasciclin (FAS1) repeats
MKKEVAIPLALLMIGLLVTPALAMGNSTIVDKAVAINSESGEFSILIAALSAEGKLIKQLSGKGQYTVFAPTDAAFEALFKETGLTAEAILADSGLLTKVLGYHVVRGNRDAETVVSSKQMRTLSKDWIKVDGTVLTDENGRQSNIIITDVFASNGVVHVIDTVLLPQ